MNVDQPPRVREVAPGVWCSVSLIAAISEQAADGYRRMPWGGVERGGLLLGRREGESVRVLESREVDCEHEFGPGFQLSAQDLASLDTTIAEVSTGPLEVVGWYRTTSRDLYLTSEDIALAGRCFAEPWQITLIVQRGKSTEPRFGVFTTEPGGREPARGLAAEFTAQSLEPERGAADEAPAGGAAGSHVDAVAATDAARGETVPETAISEPAREDPSSASVPIPETGPTGGLQRLLSVIGRHRRQEAGVVRTVVALSTKAENGSEPHPGVEINREALEQLMDEERPPFPADGWTGFFGFAMDPFAPGPDNAFYFETAAHREAQAVLDYGIAARKGVMLLSGEAGTGKTIVLERLADRLRGKRVDLALLNPGITVSGLHESIARDLGLAGSGRSKAPFHIALHERAMQRAAAGSTVVLIADDAHELAPDVLEELESLNNIESRRGKPIQLVLAGLPVLQERLDSPRLAGLKQRVVLRASLGNLTVRETEEYIRFRLTLAGGPADLFQHDPAEAVHRHTGGAPRRINALCASSLELAFRSNQRVITGETIDRAAAQIRG